ncbi:unnamed protein product, partial [marine sediment metagenome]
GYIGKLIFKTHFKFPFLASLLPDCLPKNFDVKVYYSSTNYFKYPKLNHIISYLEILFYHYFNIIFFYHRKKQKTVVLIYPYFELQYVPGKIMNILLSIIKFDPILFPLATHF